MDLYVPVGVKGKKRANFGVWASGNHRCCMGDVFWGFVYDCRVFVRP